jgi:hypothetical protein
MRSRWRHLLLLACLLLPAAAQAQAVRTERVAFEEGAESVLLRGTIQGREAVDYRVAAQAGRRVRAELTSPHQQLFMNVRAPGASATTQAGPTGGNLYDAQLTASGELQLTVFLLGEAARRGDAAEYALSVELSCEANAAAAAEPAATAPVAQAPPRDAPAAAAPQEGRFWTVANPRLNLRAGPSTRTRLVGSLVRGETLRATGDCRDVARERWCPVESGAGVQGWVAQRFLAAVPAPAPATAAEAAEAPRRPFDATGFLPCAMVRGQPSRDCRFGVERRGPGAAMVEILGANGATRRITFADGEPRSADTSAALRVEKFGDLFLIRIGDERFEVPEAVVTGG